MRHHHDSASPDAKKILPKIANYNMLNTGGWAVTLGRFPHLRYFCQKVSLPAFSWSNPTYNTPYSDFQTSGDKPETQDLTFEFVVDEEMRNWVALVQLGVAMTFPEDSKQYQAFFETNRPEETVYMDISVVMTDNAKVPMFEIVYVDCLLKSVSGLNLEIPVDMPVPVTAQASFSYSYFEIRELGRTDIKYSEKPLDPPEKVEYNTKPRGYNTHGKLFGDNKTKPTW